MPLHILVGAVIVLSVYFTFSSHFKPPFVKMRQFDGVSRKKKRGPDSVRMEYVDIRVCVCVCVCVSVEVNMWMLYGKISVCLIL